MSCGPTTLRVGGSAHTKGGVTEVFSAFTGAMEAVKLDAVKMAVELLDNSGKVQVSRAVSASNDGVTWDTAVTIGSFITAGGWDHGKGFTSVAAGKRFVRFGVVAKQAAGKDNEQIRVNLVIDLTPR